MKVNLSADEVWAVFQFVRQHDQLGREHDKEQAQRVHAALLYFRDNPAGNYDLELDEGFAWWVTRQTPVQLQVGTQLVGKAVLLKVMTALGEVPQAVTEATEEPITTVGEPYQESFRKDDEFLAKFISLYGEGES